MANEPIDKMDYLYGLKVVDIGDLRVARGKTRRPPQSCRHLHVTFDPQERRIWCEDCETDVEAFDAFVGISEFFDSAIKKLQEREQRLKEAQEFSLRSLAAKAVDDVWRGRNSVPACPCCARGLLPEDFKGGRVATTSADLERRRRQREGKDGKR